MLRAIASVTVLGVVALLASPPAPALTCQPDVPWKHAHAAGKTDTEVTDIRGSRSTRIEVCRDASQDAGQLAVEVQFAGATQGEALPPGQCAGRFTKWVLVRSHGAADSTATSEAGGVYRVCKD